MDTNERWAAYVLWEDEARADAAARLQIDGDKLRICENGQVRIIRDSLSITEPGFVQTWWDADPNRRYD